MAVKGYAFTSGVHNGYHKPGILGEWAINALFKCAGTQVLFDMRKNFGPAPTQLFLPDPEFQPNPFFVKT